MNTEDFQNVYPNLTRTMKVCKFKYTILDIVLFKSVRIAIYLYNENNLFIESTQMLIEGEDYTKWSSDDAYILNLIKAKIQQLK